MWTRRDAIKLGLASCLTAGVPSALAATRRRLPRYIVVVFLRGGMDGVYTVDPKSRSEVDPKVDVPYNANEILDTGGLQFGPHFNEMQPWGTRLSVVHGLQVRTANHESGALQVLRMKTAVNRKMPSLLDIIGRVRNGQPLSSVTLGRTSSLEHSPSGFVAPTFSSDSTFLDEMDDLSATDFDTVSQAFQDHLKAVERWAPSSQKKQTEEHLRQVAALFGRMPDVPRFRAKEWSKRKKRQTLAEDFQRTLWLLENDLTSGVYQKIFFDWDSHFRNADKQTQSNRDFAYIFNQFLEALHTRSNVHGTLADNTLVVAGSELGRFPILNGNLGKDHFPETSMMFMGPNIRPGLAFGPTGSMMEGVPVDLNTGHPGGTSDTHLFLDDIGTTLLDMAGIDPSTYGYRGRVLRFLENT